MSPNTRALFVYLDAAIRTVGHRHAVVLAGTDISMHAAFRIQKRSSGISGIDTHRCNVRRDWLYARIGVYRLAIK